MLTRLSTRPNADASQGCIRQESSHGSTGLVSPCPASISFNAKFLRPEPTSARFCYSRDVNAATASKISVVKEQDVAISQKPCHTH
jgi:hypothetical protein